jgi:hypothetical protein
MAKFEEHAARLDIKSMIITMVLSALGFLVALAWRDAIQQSIELFVPRGEGLAYTYLAAIVVTIIAAAVTFVLIRLQKIDIIPDRYEEKLKKKIKIKKE